MLYEVITGVPVVPTVARSGKGVKELLDTVAGVAAGRIAAPVVAEATDAIIDQLGLGRGSAVSVRHSGLIPIPKNEPVRLGAVV